MNANFPARDIAIARLEAAIAAYEGDTGPGCWQVERDFDRVGQARIGLTYLLGISDQPEDMAGDEPWKIWGGNAILAQAGLESQDGHADSWVDKYGDGVYGDSAIINVQGEDE